MNILQQVCIFMCGHFQKVVRTLSLKRPKQHKRTERLMIRCSPALLFAVHLLVDQDKELNLSEADIVHLAVTKYLRAHYVGLDYTYIAQLCKDMEINVLQTKSHKK